MRTNTRVRRYAVVGGWAAVAAVVASAGTVLGGCASANAAGARPADAPEQRARPAGAIARAARVRTPADDSVQVGYGYQGRRRTTGSVGSVSGDETRTQHMTRVEELLQRVPGVRVTPRGDGSYSVIVRGAAALSAYGNTDPLFVIDGVPVNDGASVLNTIAPQDVERIDVLKDAEASIYGSRSANGVILVRTRHARFTRD